MYSTLGEYYRLRGTYNTNELHRMQLESSQDLVKVMELKAALEAAITSITSFLSSQMDGSTARLVAMEKAVCEETGYKVKLAMDSKGMATVIRSTPIAEATPRHHPLMNMTVIKVTKPPAIKVTKPPATVGV